MMTEKLAECGHSLYWRGLYHHDFDLATPESIAHPAKASWDLGFKILAHLQELKLLNAGDTELDPMSGTGRFNLCAAAKGFRTISVELEPKFIEFEKANLEYAQRRLFKNLDWTILQGDARQLSQLLAEKGLVSITSSPYFQQGLPPNDTTINIRHRDYARQQYGQTEGQIGQEKGQSYLEAMSLCYSEIARVSDVLVCVLKDPTRANKIRELGKDTYRLLVSCGWTIVDYHRALLFETLEQPSLFDGVKKRYKGRVSFFKRLSLQRGQPTAWFEHILFAVRTDAIPNYSRDALHTYGNCDIRLLDYEDD